MNMVIMKLLNVIIAVLNTLQILRFLKNFKHLLLLIRKVDISLCEISKDCPKNIKILLHLVQSVYYLFTIDLCYNAVV